MTPWSSIAALIVIIIDTSLWLGYMAAGSFFILSFSYRAVYVCHIHHLRRGRMVGVILCCRGNSFFVFPSQFSSLFFLVQILFPPGVCW